MKNLNKYFLKTLFEETKSSNAEEIYVKAQDELASDKYSSKLKKILISDGFTDPDTVRLLFEEFLKSQEPNIDDSYIFTNEQERILERAMELAGTEDEETIAACVSEALSEEYKEDAGYYMVVYGFGNKSITEKMVQLFLLDRLFETKKNNFAALLLGRS